MNENMEPFSDIIHVTPINESHIEKSKDRSMSNMFPYCPCKCEPEIEVCGDAIIFIHNSFDGREGVEWANEILNTKT